MSNAIKKLAGKALINATNLKTIKKYAGSDETYDKYVAEIDRLNKLAESHINAGTTDVQEFKDAVVRLQQIKGHIMLSAKRATIKKYAKALPRTVAQYPISEEVANDIISDATLLMQGVEHSMVAKEKATVTKGVELLF